MILFFLSILDPRREGPVVYSLSVCLCLMSMSMSMSVSMSVCDDNLLGQISQNLPFRFLHPVEEGNF